MWKFWNKKEDEEDTLSNASDGESRKPEDASQPEAVSAGALEENVKDSLEETQEKFSEDDSEEASEGISEVTSGEASEGISEVTSGEASEGISEEISGETTSEKGKKSSRGFWSWLGFGKKGDQETDGKQDFRGNEDQGLVSQEQAQEPREQDVQEQAQELREQDVQEQAQGLREQDVQEQAQGLQEHDVQEQAQRLQEQDVQEQAQELQEQGILEEARDIQEQGIQEEAQDIQEHDAPQQDQEHQEESEQTKYQEKKGFFARLKEGLAKTRDNIVKGIDNLFGGFTSIDEDFYEELEEILIMGDIGVNATAAIIERLKFQVKERHVKDPKECKELLIQSIREQMEVGEAAYEFETKQSIIMVIGVNGVGKTTTVGKLAWKLKDEGKKVLIAAADTFRAAAGDQLAEWARRAGVPMIGGKEGADPASVVFDAVNAAKARGVDVLLIDTAGRLHNKKNLMEELRKMNRIVDREYPDAHRENLIVLDGTTGQNAMVQAREFGDVADLTGIVLTKMDGTAKGGIAVAIQSELKIPVKYIGVGETVQDLQKFDPDDFVNALFDVDLEEKDNEE